MTTSLLIVFIGGSLAVPYAPYSSGWNPWINGNGFSSDVSRGFNQMSSVLEQQVGDLNDQMNRHLTSFNSMVGEVGRNLEEMSEDLSGDVADILNVGRNKMSSVVGQALDGIGKLPRLDSNLFDEFPRINLGMPRIDSSIFGDLDSNMFGIFAPARKPWWEGENVCIDREVVEGEGMEGVNIQVQGNVHMQVHRCEEREGVYECQQSVLENQEMKTIKSTYSCCHGYKLTQERVCQEFDIRPMEETISDLDGTEFLTLLSEENLVGSLSNSTVFVPDDQAIKDFKTELAGLATGGDHGNVVYSVDSGLLARRKKRNVGLVVDEQLALKDILLGHISPQILNVKDFTNNEIISTKSGSSSIRMSVYNTYPKKVVLANCALITSKDHHTTNGVVHVVNKVIQPTTQTIGEILSADLQFRTFTSALDVAEMRKLKDGNQTFTVFVPTDKAFQDLDPATLEKVLGSGSCGNHILRSHILPTIVCSGVIQGRVQVSTSAGERLTLRRDAEDQVYVEDRQLVMKDMMATNGVIHVIDSVIIPDSARTVEEALNRRKANKFTDLLEKSNLMAKLNSLENFTLYLPSNKALNEIPDTVLTELGQDVQKLEELVLHHVVPHSGGHEMTALSGQKHLTRKHEAPGTVSCARFVGREEKVCGGRVQTIDRLLVVAGTSVLDSLRSSPDHSQFYRLLQSTHLSDELTGPYTLLAPTDQAFQNLPAETIHKIFGDKILAEKLVKNHIVPELVCCSTVPTYFQFSRGVRTLGGQSIHLRRSHGGRVLVNRGSVERCDVVGTDGVLHSLDTVLLPRQLQDDGQSYGSTFWKF